MTRTTFLTTVFRELNIVGRGETLSGDMLTDAETILARLLDAWKLKRSTIPTVVRTVFALSATQSYTIGSGATFNVVRPTFIDAAGVLPTAGEDDEIPIAVLTDQQYRNWYDKGATSARPSAVYYDRSINTTTGYGTVRVLPTPESSTPRLALYIPTAIPLFADRTTDYRLPDGLERALHYNVGVEIGPAYPGAVTDAWRALAIEAKADFQSVNDQPGVLRVDAALVRGPATYDITRGPGS